MEKTVEYWAHFAPFTDNSTYNNVTTGRSMYRRAVKRLHIRASHPIGIMIKLENSWKGGGSSRGGDGIVQSIQCIEIPAVRQYELRIAGVMDCFPGEDNQVKVLEITREYYQQSHVKNQ